MSILYDLIFLIFTLIYLPLYLFRRKIHAGLRMRLGILPGDLVLDRPIWVHAVSVGEAMAVRGLIEELRSAYPGKNFVISTVTATGNKIARGLARGKDLVTYLPFDFGFIVRSVIDRVNPAIFVIAETEIWPNLILYLYRKNIPVITVNGRVSDASFRGYLAIKILLKPILGKVSLFCVQTGRDAQRLLRLGVSGDKIKITGNMKFDIKVSSNMRRDPAEAEKKDDMDYRKKLSLESGARLLVAGSTHPREEEAVLGAYKGLLNEFAQLKLLLAPRHPERAKEIGGIVSGFGFRPVFLSAITAECPTCLSRPVFILDTVGELTSFYAIADIVFVGGSLIKKGGHNILEPASLGKPVLFGPYMFNFRDIADLFLTNRAALLVKNQDELKSNITYLLNSPSEAAEMGKRGYELILKNQGASRRNAGYVKAYTESKSS
jgi:3-deoxy-D-manno-octulosonic-acid transferase